MFHPLDPTDPRLTATERLLQRGGRHCPVCGQAMETIHEHDAVADVCPEHGVWFDRDQWERFVSARCGASEHRANQSVAAARPTRRGHAVADEADDEGPYEHLFDLGGGD
jgi:Zn-finger nucleic acid-binding protein